MKSKVLIKIIFELILIVGFYGIVFGAEPDKQKDEPKLDSHWLKENQEMLSFINDKKTEEAIEKAEKTISYLKKHKLLESQEAATTYNNLGMAFLTKGQFDKAQGNLLKALQLRTKIFGNTSLEVATVWLNLSQLYKMQAEYIFKLHQKDIQKETTESDKTDKNDKDSEAKGVNK